jgi:ribosomal protein L27
MPSVARIADRVVRLLAIGAVVWTSGASAQRVEVLPVGARIIVDVTDSACVSRFWRQCPPNAGLSGTFVRATADTLTMRLGKSVEVAIPRRADQRLFVRQRGSRVLSGIRIGMLAGMASGIVTSQTDASRRSCVQVTATAAVAGLVAGAIWPTTLWRRVAP